MEYKGTKEVIVSIPLDLVYESSYNNQLSIIGEDFYLEL